MDSRSSTSPPDVFEEVVKALAEALVSADHRARWAQPAPCRRAAARAGGTRLRPCRAPRRQRIVPGIVPDSLSSAGQFHPTPPNVHQFFVNKIEHISA